MKDFSTSRAEQGKLKIQDSHIRQFKCTGPSKWLVEEWFRVSVRVSVRVRLGLGPGNTVLPFLLFFAVGLFLSCCFVRFFCQKSFDVTSVLNVTSRVLYICYIRCAIFTLVWGSLRLAPMKDEFCLMSTPNQ